MDTFMRIASYIATSISSGAVIGAFALKIGRGILAKELEPFSKKIDETNKMREEQHEETKKEILSLREELKINTLNTLKCTMCNKEMPMSERLEAGRLYIENGGNGGGKIYYHKLEEEYEASLNKNENNKVRRGNGRK